MADSPSNPQIRRYYKALPKPARRNLRVKSHPGAPSSRFAGTTSQNPGTDELIKDGLGLADQRRGGGGDHAAIRDRPGPLGRAAWLGARD